MARHEAEKAAEEILATTWGKRGIPVDPVVIAKQLGIETFETELDPNVSGAIVKTPGRDPQILLNIHDSSNRKRFSCAHEIGHFVRRTNGLENPDSFEYVDLRGPLASQGDQPEEVYANQFAAALLMPEDLVREHFQRGSASELVVLFAVSPEAMTFRLKNLGLD